MQPPSHKHDIYHPEFVLQLFDEMSGSYARMNYITSFGFSERWRRQLVRRAQVHEGEVVADLMTGMGECWKPILRGIGPTGKLIALDFSEGMLRYARARLARYPAHEIVILKEDLFNNSIPDRSVDVALSGFGMKTFSSEQLAAMARTTARMLKPGGRVALMDVSTPSAVWMKGPYMFYLKRVIPFLGRLFLGNPENYRMLGRYSEQFGNAREVAEIFKAHGFEVKYVEYFFGCASGIVAVLKG
jgi:ubiquinone/menaquinone biosynthesis methyltransferase